MTKFITFLSIMGLVVSPFIANANTLMAEEYPYQYVATQYTYPNSYNNYGYQQQGYGLPAQAGYGAQNYGAYINSYMGGNQYGYNYNPYSQYGNGYGYGSQNYGYGYGPQRYQTQGVYGILPGGYTYYNSGYPKQNCYYSSYYYVCQ